VTGYYGSDGKLRLAYLSTQILRRTETATIDGQTYEIPNIPEDGQTDLRLLEHSLITDLAITNAGLELSPVLPGAGESVTATVTVRNAGDFSVSAFNIKLYAGNPSSGGTLLGTTRINAPFAGGDTRSVTMAFVYPETPRNIVAVIDADNEIGEFSEINNLAAIYFENAPPIVLATANVTSGNSPLTVNFDASSSYDIDGDALLFAWAFADGSQGASGVSVSHIFQQTGLYPVTVSVTDARGAASMETVYVSVNCNPLSITPAVLPAGLRGNAYAQNLSAGGGDAPYTFAVSSGSLPAGLTLSPAGLLSGTPTDSGVFNFTVTATYGNGCPGTRDYALTISQSATKLYDYDGDGKADISVFRPPTGSWYLINSSNNAFLVVAFGAASDLIAPADFDGDGKTDISVFRPTDGSWYRLNSSNNTFSGIQFGAPGDLPVPGDFDGDNRAETAVYRPSAGSWYRINSSNAQLVANQFGIAEDKPLVGDFDGDGRNDLAVFRPSNGTWYRLNSSNEQFAAAQFGNNTDKPVPADYDGDGKTDLAVYRPAGGYWYVIRSSDGSFNAVQFGIADDKPSPADFDGDGKSDLAVFRPGTGTWYLLRSQTGFTGVQFGTNGDLPTPNAFVR
jgi:PKD repeat protein